MSKKQKPASPTTPDQFLKDRRAFLTLGIAASLAGVSATGPSGKAKATAPEDDQTGNDGLYRETEHIRTYYKLARF